MPVFEHLLQEVAKATGTLMFDLQINIIGPMTATDPDNLLAGSILDDKSRVAYKALTDIVAQLGGRDLTQQFTQQDGGPPGQELSAMSVIINTSTDPLRLLMDTKRDGTPPQVIKLAAGFMFVGARGLIYSVGSCNTKCSFVSLKLMSQSDADQLIDIKCAPPLLAPQMFNRA